MSFSTTTIFECSDCLRGPVRGKVNGPPGEEPIAFSNAIECNGSVSNGGVNGSVQKNVVPRPIPGECAQILPPCATMVARTIDNARQRPFVHSSHIYTRY